MYKFSDNFKTLAMLYQLHTSEAALHATKRGVEVKIEMEGKPNDAIFLLAITVAKVCSEFGKTPEEREQLIHALFKHAQDMMVEDNHESN